MNGRSTARCSKCRSLERTRYLWLFLRGLGLPKPGMRILHMAPERPLAREFYRISPELYHPTDVYPEMYNVWATCRPLNLCTDLVKLPSKSFDLIVHNHVLEHIPCSVEKALEEIHRILAPGGWHIFSVPFRNGNTVEDLTELTAAERTERFGQHDHMRLFGTTDFPHFLKDRFGIQPVRAEEFLELTELEAAAIPYLPNAITGHSLFAFNAPDEEPESKKHSSVSSVVLSKRLVPRSTG